MLSILRWGEACTLLEHGIERGLRIEAGVQTNGQHGERVAVWVFEMCLHFFDAVAIDEVIEILPESGVDEFREVMGGDARMVSQILKGELRVAVQLGFIHQGHQLCL